jgi:FAD/FMN-containing dehydrogenase/Fe-S oxidoreductase
MNFQKLTIELEKSGIIGEIFFDKASKAMYATDASAYREYPLAVVYPKNNEDIQRVIDFAQKHKIGIIPRAAGTSLAGQVVGSGIVVDISKYLNRIIELNIDEKWVKVQPGVVLDELNMYLQKYNLFFAPETSTSNRCMIGGMVGNNACGAHSLIYGSTRDHLLEVSGFLSDGSEVTFGAISKEQFAEKYSGIGLESEVYKQMQFILENEQNQINIRKEYPDPDLKRRNTGYAIDILLDSEPFTKTDKVFNFSKLIAGSEGTLMFLTEIKLNLIELSPKIKALQCIHFQTLEEALDANLLVLNHKPDAIELIDNIIVNCTKENIEQRKNRFFIKDDPGAILIVEISDISVEVLKLRAMEIEKELVSNGFGYHFPLVFGSDINKVWALRKAALGLLSNVPGDAKPVAVIEDTAVTVNKLKPYIVEFKQILEKYNLSCVFHAHVATGELHLRPVLNLKEKEHVKLFRILAEEIAHLVKKYKGSLSGEHGDGRLRGEFIPIIIGTENFELLKQIKHTWDPEGLFNPGKITHTPSMDTSLRIQYGIKNKKISTYFNFSDSNGILGHIERCNGSADCRKSEIIGGTMCPSYMATRNESTSTRARANVLREFITNSDKKNPFDYSEIKETLDLCLSCKACKAECPSNVDMTKLKAEFLQHYHDEHGIPVRSWFVGNMPKLYGYASLFPKTFNYIVKNETLSEFIKKRIGFAQERNIPLLSSETLTKWCKKHLEKQNNSVVQPKKQILFFIDEFTNYTDTEIGIKAIKLLNYLGYKISIAPIKESGRTYLSKGLIKKAKSIVFTNVNYLKSLVTNNTPMVGVEPSSVLTFRDEYVDLVPENLIKEAQSISLNTFTIEEFLANEIDNGVITKESFTKEVVNIKLHGHCYLKSIASTKPVITMLSIPENYMVVELKTGCCGMAGSFGYENEHYTLSMQIGELTLFPAIRKANIGDIIAASGTSCRQQIMDGTGVQAYHPIEILYSACFGLK